MSKNILILFSIVFPIISGFVLLCYPKVKDRKKIQIYMLGVFGITGGFVSNIITGRAMTYTLYEFMESIPIYFKIDNMGRLFASLVTIAFILSGLYSFGYMEHERNEKRYFGFYLIVYGVFLGLIFSGNIVTLYIFYELLTLTSFFLVIYAQTREAVMAAMKYMFYSLCGAYMALFGIYFLYQYGTTLEFTPGGVLDPSLLQGKEEFFLFIAFFMLIGFSVKAGMFPMHGWLSSAHPVAPAPASGILSGIIVKAGVFAIIRIVFEIFGADFLKGSWVQQVWMTLSLITIFMGSMLAYKESIVKKRFAYSTVSQISYILFGLSLLEPKGFVGALFHTCVHIFVKTGLFLAIGGMIFKTGNIKVEHLDGIGKKMPFTLWCYTLLSLSLIGIPPAGGFLSKWFLAIGSLESGISVFSWIGPIILVVSALLTAGYVLPITMNGFFPKADWTYKRDELRKVMVIPILILTVLEIGRAHV